MILSRTLKANFFTIEIEYTSGITKEGEFPGLSENSVRWNESEIAKNANLDQFSIETEADDKLTFVTKSTRDDSILRITITYSNKTLTPVKCEKFSDSEN
jgi:hypothetical protein